jgi:hypothetical protein
MSFQKEWIENDLKVEELRRRMMMAREEYRLNNPHSTIDSEETYLNKIFKDDFKGPLGEQIRIMADGLHKKEVEEN